MAFSILLINISNCEVVMLLSCYHLSDFTTIGILEGKYIKGGTKHRDSPYIQIWARFHP